MVSQRLFDSLPPFPEDVPTAPVPKYSLSKLSSGDSTYTRQLFETCCTVGFFLLDMGGDETGDKMIQEIDTMFDLSNKVFDLDTEEKSQYAMDASKGRYTGWKDVGMTKTESGKPDRCEFYSIVQDQFVGNSPSMPHPDALESQRSIVSSFINHAHSIIVTILSILDENLGLERGTLASLVSLERTSGTVLRMLRYSPQPPADRRTSLLKHTDIGAITLLSSVLGGLQILPPGNNSDPADESAWRFVRPEPNCAVVNLGDALVEWSGGILRSNMHRVTFAPGVQADHERHSIAYLVRGNNDVSMKRLRSDMIPSAADDGEVDLDLTCEDWELNKNRALTLGTDCARSRGGRNVASMVKAY